jgi:hypothetical protein
MQTVIIGHEIRAALVRALAAPESSVESWAWIRWTVSACYRELSNIAGCLRIVTAHVDAVAPRIGSSGAAVLVQKVGAALMKQLSIRSVDSPCIPSVV